MGVLCMHQATRALRLTGDLYTMYMWALRVRNGTLFQNQLFAINLFYIDIILCRQTFGAKALTLVRIIITVTLIYHNHNVIEEGNRQAKCKLNSQATFSLQ